MANTLRYIQYARKSSEAKEKQALSIEDQKAECQKYALHENLNIVYRLEEAKSSYKPHNRPEFDRMVALIESKQADAILTWKPDRLCRNPEEGGKLLQMLQDGIIKEIRTATGDNYNQESDHLVLQIHFGMANQYSRNLSQNVKRGLNHKAERGEFPRPAILGYKSTGDRGKRIMELDPFEAPIIRDAFNLARTGYYSLGYVCDYFSKRGLRTKRGKKISKSHVYVILTSSTYYGYFYHNGELHKGTYEPLVSKQLFDEVQEALKDRSKPRKFEWNHEFNGLIRCADCGCAISTSFKTKYYKETHRKATYIYHRCTRRRGNCHQKPITADEMNKALLDNLIRIKIDEETWQLGIKLLKEKHKYETEQNIQDLTHYQNQYRQIQERINRLIDMRADGELTREEFMAQKEILLKEQASFEALLNDNKNSARNWLELTEKYLNTAYYIRETMEHGKPEAKKQLILDVGENLLFGDKKLDFSFKKPYDVLLLPEYRTNVLPREDSNLEPSS